jgi:hypothetical protein
MLRAPMSRMDILSEKEIKHVLDNSRLIHKYNQDIDRDSAYEMLNEKIESIHKKEAKAIQEAKETKTRARTATRRRRSTAQNPIIKVLTSATFIRSVFGILKKVLK